MRMTTEVWAKLESKGRPKDLKIVHGSLRFVIIEIANWLTSVYMGSHINIRLARSEEELNSAVSGDAQTMMSELESLLGPEIPEEQEELFDGQDQQASPEVLRVVGGNE